MRLAHHDTLVLDSYRAAAATPPPAPKGLWGLLVHVGTATSFHPGSATPESTTVGGILN